MRHSYYIDVNGQKDGPHDLVNIMRRIRDGRLNGHSLIYLDNDHLPREAALIPEIRQFFPHSVDEQHNKPSHAVTTQHTLTSVLAAGWQFTMQHNIMTVFAGGLLIINLMLYMTLTNVLGDVTGSIVSWCLFLTFHHIYMLFVLRMCRGQPVGSDFVNRQFAPILGKLILLCLLTALMMAGGTLLLVIPGIAVAVIYIFAPLFILDHGFSPVEALQASRTLIAKRGTPAVKIISTLMVLHLLAVVFIIPLPVTLPLFAACFCELYEELSTS